MQTRGILGDYFIRERYFVIRSVTYRDYLLRTQKQFYFSTYVLLVNDLYHGLPLTLTTVFWASFSNGARFLSSSLSILVTSVFFRHYKHKLVLYCFCNGINAAKRKNHRSQQCSILPFQQRIAGLYSRYCTPPYFYKHCRVKISMTQFRKP